MLEINRDAVVAILAELNPRILGKKHEGIECSCGAIHAGPAEAVRIEPAGDKYPGQEMRWYLWTVSMQDQETRHHSYSLGLSEFVDADEVRALFEKHFGTKEEIFAKELQGDVYKPATNGKERVHAKLPAAISIQENPQYLRFTIDWGNEQSLAGVMQRMSEIQRFADKGTQEYFQVLWLLKMIRNPEVYARGPKPVLDFECQNLMDFAAAIELAEKGEFVRAVLSGTGSSTDFRGSVYTNSDVVFLKHL